MDSIQQVESAEQLKVLADDRRLAILRVLMAEPATLSGLGRVFGQHPAWIRHHLKQLEQAGLVRMTTTRQVRGFVEKYYQATARAFAINTLILPRHPERELIVALGSHDLALELLADHMHQDHRLPDVLALPVGSLEGLIALRQGAGHLAGCHLWDTEQGEYNRPYVRHLFPGRPVALVTLAHRQQGLLVPPGNPRKMRDLEDLAQEDAVFINRNQGSGTRLWLDHHLGNLGISPQQIRGYQRAVSTHTAVARAVAEGQADAGLGLLAAARQGNLDFIPLFQERYDLVIPQEQYESALLQPILDRLQSAGFRRAVEGLGGYDITHTGEITMMGQ